MDADRLIRTSARPCGRSWPVLPLLLVLALLGGCASLAPPTIGDDERSWVMQGAGMLAASDAHLIEADSLLVLTDEMRAFAQAAVQGRRGTERRLSALADALSSEDGLGLRYDATATLTAREAFEQRRANCLAYTLLFIALAREVGIQAKFNDVDVPPIWDLRGDDGFILYRHINARVEVTASAYTIVDVAREEYDRSFPQRTISDRQAQAQYFNNRAVELRLEGRSQEALRHQLRAIELDPDRPYLWANLSQFYLAEGNVDAASLAVRTALVLDPRDAAIYGTATDIYEALGDRALARLYRKRAEHYLRQNPYYHYQLAMVALAQNEQRQAFAEVRKAIELYPGEHRFLYLLGVVLLRMDEPQLAEVSIQAAIALSSDQTQQARYRSKLSRLPQFQHSNSPSDCGRAGLRHSGACTSG